MCGAQIFPAILRNLATIAGIVPEAISSTDTIATIFASKPEKFADALAFLEKLCPDANATAETTIDALRAATRDRIIEDNALIASETFCVPLKQARAFITAHSPPAS